uniref:Uncharacterized protein n=2 Tax=Plectus sambesii TaxID=2011161 RepID=A0A914UT26_9BILA
MIELVQILGMIEEAAGTKMYETKKQSAIKTIEKKDAKVGEINRLLAEDIMPRVEQLKSDRANYLEFNKLTREVEALERKSVAYDFYASQATCKQSENEIAQKNVEIGAIDSKVEANEATTAEIHAEIKKLEDKKEDGKKKQLEEGEKGALDQQAKAMSKFEGAQDAVKAANVEVTRRNKTLKEDEKAMEKKQKELAKAEEEIGGAAQRGTDAEEAVQKARKKLEAIAKGMTTDDDGQAVTLEEQLTNARTALSDINTKVKLAENRLKQLQPSLAKKKRELLNVSDRADSKDKKAALEKDLEAID